jgi:hypothetical protein
MSTRGPRALIVAPLFLVSFHLISSKTSFVITPLCLAQCRNFRHLLAEHYIRQVTPGLLMPTFPPDDSCQVCADCLRVFTRKFNSLVSLQQKRDRDLLVQSAKDGCYLCAALADLAESSYLEDPRDSLIKPYTTRRKFQ